MAEKTKEAARAEVIDFQKSIGGLREEVGKMIVGNRDVVDGVLTCMLAGSHALLEGVPGLGKTMLVRTMAEALDLQFSRIQFTPDMMPADIIGTTVIDETQGGAKSFSFRKGPIFANIVLADEINRATPKTQSALLEAMQERQVTIEGDRFELPLPFLVLATQNPVDLEGTYPLPEAQIDRFLVRVSMGYPSPREEAQMIKTHGIDPPTSRPVLDARDVVQLQAIAARVYLEDDLMDYAVAITGFTLSLIHI